VATGTYEPEDLLLQKPDACVTSCAELLQMIQT